MEVAAALPSRLRLTVLRLSRRLRQEGTGEITPSQLSALTSIKLGGELSLGELAAIERVAPPSMTRIAARLEEAGLVARRPDPSDRRVSRLGITEAGEALLAANRTARDAFLAERLGRLSDDDQALVALAVPLLEVLIGDDPQGMRR